MSSTNFITGLGDNTKPSSKVLRPPGGGNSQLFGDDAPSTPRVVKNHMASNIFGSDPNSSVKQNGGRAGKTGDSFNRLFGEPERNFTPAKNHMKSSIPFGASNGANGSTSSLASSSNGSEHKNGHKNGNGVHHNGHNGHTVTDSASSASSSVRNGKMENGSSCASSDYQNGGSSRSNGNPVTGEGYKGAEINTTIPALNGANQVINKNRIPPGGFSSGLW